MTKVDLITGFLGAGKTTFIRRYADHLKTNGEKIHIIENEFGGISIDAHTLSREDLDVSQIGGGCMCCTGKAAFISSLLEAAESGCSRILVEPSGIYDVRSFFETLSSDPVCRVCEAGNIITVADSLPSPLLSAEAQYLMFSQLIYSGCVLLSKTQFRTEDEINAALNDLQKILVQHGSTLDLTKEQLCIVKPWDALTPEDFDRISGCGCRTAEQAKQIMDHMSIFSTSMMAGRFDTVEHLEQLMHEIMDTGKYGKVYRIKGYIADLDKNWYELNCSPGGCFIEKSPIKHGVFLVIGQDYDEKAISRLFLPRN